MVDGTSRTHLGSREGILVVEEKTHPSNVKILGLTIEVWFMYVAVFSVASSTWFVEKRAHLAVFAQSRSMSTMGDGSLI